MGVLEAGTCSIGCPIRASFPDVGPDPVPMGCVTAVALSDAFGLDLVVIFIGFSPDGRSKKGIPTRCRSMLLPEEKRSGKSAQEPFRMIQGTPQQKRRLVPCLAPSLLAVFSVTLIQRSGLLAINRMYPILAGITGLIFKGFHTQAEFGSQIN